MELNRLRDTGAVAGHGSEVGRSSRVALLSVQRLLPRGARDQSLSLSKGIHSDLDLTRVLDRIQDSP